MTAVIIGPFQDENFALDKFFFLGGDIRPTGLVLSLGIIFCLPALPRIFMLGYTKACQVCLIFFHPRDDKLYLEKKQIIGKICMQKTYFSDSFRFGSIQCVKRTVVLI